MPKETFYRLRDDKQERIIRSAIHEFIENGFERAKVEEIARNAAVAKGSIYQYFEDKKELFLYCAKWGIQVFMKAIDKHADPKADIFSYFLDSASKSYVISEERELAVFMQTIEREPSLVEESLKGMYEASDLYIKTLIDNSIKRGVVRSDIDEELLKEYFIGITDRFEKRWMKRYIDFTIDMSEEKIRALQNELNQMLELLKNGMGC